MNPVTLALFGITGFLIVANIAVSFLPKKNAFKIAFIPPSATPSALTLTDSSNAKLDAHISSTNQKISALFSRVESLEKSVQSLLDSSSPVKDETWLQTVPVRNSRKPQ